MAVSKRVSAVIFDMDGILIDSEPIFRRAAQRAAELLGHVVSDRLYAELIGLPSTAVEEVLHGELGPGFDREAFNTAFERYWLEYVETEGIAEKPGVSELLETLRRHSCPYAVATSTRFDQAEFSLETAGLADRIDILVTGDHVVNGKPAPDIFLHAASRLNTEPERCIVIEDSEAGIEGAAAAGMRSIMVPDLKQPSTSIASLAYRIVPSMREATRVIMELLEDPPGRIGVR